jgi:hypothetical protein
MNEPGSPWWKYGNKQEGCYMGKEQQCRVLKKAERELRKLGLDTGVVGSEGNEVWMTLDSLKSCDRGTVQDLHDITTHSYGYATDPRDQAALAKKYDSVGVPVRISEFGTGVGPGQGSLVLAKRIVNDLLFLKPRGWTLWQVASLHNDFTQEGWAQIVSTVPPERASYQYRPQYYAYKQFTAFIRPGSTILGGCRLCAYTPTHIAVALLPDKITGAIVVVRTGEPLLFSGRFMFHVAGYEITDVIAAYTTDASHNCSALRGLPDLKRGGLEIDLEKLSITTYVVKMNKQHIASWNGTYNGIPSWAYGGLISITLAAVGGLISYRCCFRKAPSSSSPSSLLTHSPAE